MAIIGTFGDVVFSVTEKEVKTFDNLKWASSVRYATHNRHLKIPLKEFLGPKEETITFNMIFSAFEGVNPMEEIKKLLIAERSGKANNLIIGPKAYGRSKWVIESLNMGLKRFDNKGNLLTANVGVKLIENARR